MGKVGRATARGIFMDNWSGEVRTELPDTDLGQVVRSQGVTWPVSRLLDAVTGIHLGFSSVCTFFFLEINLLIFFLQALQYC